MKKIKNNKTSTDVWCGQEIEPNQYYQIQLSEEYNWANDSKVLSDIGSGNLIINDGTSDIIEISDAINFLKDLIPIDAKIISQVDPPPFAEPTFRTKINATSSIKIVPIGETTTVDFQLTQERYVSGGCIIVKNSEFGDYLTAEVYDKDGIIPEAYRSALCENWPCVSKYIEKQWLKVCGLANCIHEIDTRPLNAKINAGLYLRVTYYPTNSGSNREILINYNLTKKL